MGIINQGLTRGLGSILLLASLVSCATIPELKVHYQLPPASDELKGKRVYLAIEDARKTKEIFGEAAKKEFGNYTGNITFSVARYNEPGFKIGPFELTAMVQEGFKRRLENAGLEVLSVKSYGEPQLLIVLNEFLIDLVDRKWVAKMAYEARLMKDGQTLSTQVIDGEAERLKLIGRGEADTVSGEIFTDMINRVNLLRLFQQANLMG
jgi:hypothetical protein